MPRSSMRVSTIVSWSTSLIYSPLSMLGSAVGARRNDVLRLPDLAKRNDVLPSTDLPTRNDVLRFLT